MKVLSSFPIMVEVSVYDPGAELSSIYVVRSSNGQPISFCFDDAELAAYISGLRDDVVEEVKHSKSGK